MFFHKNSETYDIHLPPRPSVGQGAVVPNVKNSELSLKSQNCRVYPHHLQTFTISPVFHDHDCFKHYFLYQNLKNFLLIFERIFSKKWKIELSRDESKLDKSDPEDIRFS